MELMAHRRTLVLVEALREVAAANPLSVRVSGDCMAPLVRDGAKVRVSGPARFYWPGDVVAVLTGRPGLALHRVIGCYRRDGRWRFITQGDKTAWPDTGVSSRQILGRVCGGECSERLVRIPLRSRLWALARFVGYAVNINIARRISREFR